MVWRMSRDVEGLSETFGFSSRWNCDIHLESLGFEEPWPLQGDSVGLGKAWVMMVQGHLYFDNWCFKPQIAERHLYRPFLFPWSSVVCYLYSIWSWDKYRWWQAIVTLAARKAITIYCAYLLTTATYERESTLDPFRLFFTASAGLILLLTLLK